MVKIYNVKKKESKQASKQERAATVNIVVDKTREEKINSHK